MKSLIQKIIVNYFGTFINGIQKDKLSVDLLGGNFKLENISLNHEYFNGLNTPFNLTYSSIGKLNLQAPLSKLSSTPVQCTLDNIYAVFQFRDHKEKEQMSAQQQFIQKKQQLQKYIRQMFQNYLKKLRQKQDKKQQGMMSKMGKKIIDNLQLKIVNVHIRFQQKGKISQYGWGLTLQQISFVTTDRQWKPAFIDRSVEANRNQKLLKKMNLKSLCIYWQSSTMSTGNIFIRELKNEKEKSQKMGSMIKDKKYSIINLTSEFKLIINPKQDFKAPLYELSVDLAPIKFDLQRVQVSEMIDFTKKNLIQSQQILKNLTSKKKKSNQTTQFKDKEKYQKLFFSYVQECIDKHEKIIAESIQQMQDMESKQMLKILFSKVQYEQLLVMALKPIRNKVKLSRQRQLKKKKKGWFGGQYQLTQDQVKALEDFVQQNQQKQQEKQRPKSCLFFSLFVMINGGKFSFFDHKGKAEQQKIQFNIGKIQTTLQKSQNESLLNLKLNIHSIGLDLYLPAYNSEQTTKMNILKNDIESGSHKNQKFIDIHYKKVVQTGEKPIIDTEIEGEIKRIIFTYKKIYMKKFKQFFTFKNLNQQVKKQTMKKLGNPRKDTQQSIQIQSTNQQEQVQVIKHFKIHFIAISPLFICPLDKNDAWCLNLGDLTVFSEKQASREKFPMKITSAYFRYYPDMKYIFESPKVDQLIEKPAFSVVNNINFSIVHTIDLENNISSTNVDLPNFQVNFTEVQYNNLLTLKNIFKTEDGQTNFLEVLKKNRKQVQAKMKYSGMIEKKNENLDTWRVFYGILSEQHIHLYGSQKQLKCIEKISIRQARLQYDQQNGIISLHDQEGIIEIKGTQHENNSINWKNSLESQLKQFMSITEYIQMAENQQKSKNNIIRKRKQTGTSDTLKKSLKQLKINIDKISFIYQNESGKELINFQIIKFNFSQQKQKTFAKRSIQIKQFFVTDYIHLYKNKKLQTLLHATNMAITLNRFKNETHKKIQVDVCLPQIQINWKPDVLIILLQLIYKHFSKQKKLRVDDGTQKTRQQIFEQIFSDKKFDTMRKQYQRKSADKKVKDKRLKYCQKNKHTKQLVSVNCKIKSMQIVMIHRQSHIPMFKLLTDNIDNQFVMGQDQKFVAGSITSLYLYDLTGYPKSQYKQGQVQKQFCVIKPKDKIGDEQMISYKWSSYDAFKIPNTERVNSFLYVSVNPMVCFYFQQITFRLIDYFLIQIILLLNQPDMLVANQNLLEQLKKSTIDSNDYKEDKLKSSSQSFGQHSTIVKILFSEYQQVIKKIVNPYFMDMYFELKNPSIYIKPQKKCEVYHRADFYSVEFSNQNIKNSNRFKNSDCQQAKKYIYEEQYVIICRKCDFYTISEDKQDLMQDTFIEQKLFQDVDINLLVNKLIQEDQINVIYPQISNYDRSFYTHSIIKQLGINKCTKQQYLLLNKLINFNVIFDDNKDQLFIHNFKITKLLSPKPIYFELKIPHMYLRAKQGNQDHFFDLFDVQMKEFKMIFQRNKDLNSSFQIILKSTSVSGYQYPLNQSNSLNDTSKLKPQKIQLMQIKGQNEQQCLQTKIRMKNTGQKVIELNILQIQTNLKAHLLQLILQWSLLEDWVFPTVSIYANDITFHLTIHKMSAWLVQNIKLDKKYEQPESLQLVGVFCYKFHRKSNYSQQHLEQMYKRKQTTTNQINGMPDYSYMTVIMNTQIFHCRPEAHINYKRQVAQKMTFNFIQRKFYKVASQQNFTIKTNSNRQLNIDRSSLKISFTDVVLMEQILGDMGKDMKYIGNLRKALYKSKKNLQLSKSQRKLELQHIQKQLNLTKQTQISSLQNLQVEIQSLAIYLINNSRGQFTPVMRINISSASLSQCTTFKKDIIKGNCVVTAYYFNGSIFKWEPMLQKCQILFQKFFYKSENEPIKSFSSIQSTNSIILNISKEYVLALKDVMNQWNKKKKKNKDKKVKEVKYSINSSLNQIGHEKHVEQSRQMVSQYIIINQTGYPIQIYSHGPKKLIKIIKHGQQMNYEYELENFQNQDNIDLDAMIGIQIQHPQYQFKRITHIPLDFSKQFHVLPVIQGQNVQSTKKKMPISSYLRFINQIKDLRKYCIIKSSKQIEDYTHNCIRKRVLKFDNEDTVTLMQQPHANVKVSLYRKYQTKKYRYIGINGFLKILPYNIVYNHTPIPLNINNLQVMPGQFIGVFQTPRIHNVRYDDCKILKIQKKQNTRQYFVYCQGYLIDYAGLYFQFGSSYDTKSLSHTLMNNGLRFTIYLLPSSQCKFKVRLNPKYRSTNEFQCSATLKSAVGNQPFYLQSPVGAFCEYQSYGYLSQFKNNQYTDFKKIIQITPYYVLENSTNMRIKICQAQSCESMTLQKNQRIPLYWQNRKKPLQIKIAAFTEDTMWGYSGGLQIKQNVHSFVLRNTVKLADYKIFNISLQNTNTITLVHINEINEQKGGVLMLCNEVLGVNLKFYQTSVFEKDHQIMDPAQYIFEVKPGDKVAFGYQFPLDRHELVMEAQFDKNYKQYKGAYIKPFIFENIENSLYDKQVYVHRDGKKIKKLLIQLVYQGNVKKLKFLEQKQIVQEQNLGQFLCKLPQLSINLIGYQQKIRKQIAAIYFDGIQYQKALTNLTSTQTLVVRAFKLDNCLKFQPIFPTLIISTVNKFNQDFLTFNIIRDKQNINLIHYLFISVNKLVLSVTSDQIKCLQQNIAEMQSSWQEESSMMKFRQYQMFKQKPKQTINDYYFIEAIIAPVQANFTFKQVNDWGGRILRAFASIDNCNISVNGKKITHFSSRNVSEFMKIITKHYEEGIKNQFIPMLGNLSIIGSPISLVNRIGSGVKDFIELPSEGFNVGLKEGGKGIAKGTGSLFKNTFQGTFNSIQSITGSVGNGISSFVFDQDFNTERNKIKNQRSQHVGEGLKSGGKSILNGIGKGITGVVTQPVRGAQTSGIGGFLVGSIKGLTGLVTKPVSGIIDATTKTFEGIKNTPSYFQKKDKGLTNGRIRNPRAFYGFNRELRSYDEDISLCAKMLVDQDDQKYENLSWYNIYHLSSDKSKQKKPLLLLTFQFLVIYNIKNGKIMQSYQCEFIEKAQPKSSSQIIINIYDKKRDHSGKLVLSLQQSLAQRLSNQINTICRFYRPAFGYDYEVKYQKFNPTK